MKTRLIIAATALLVVPLTWAFSACESSDLPAPTAKIAVEPLSPSDQEALYFMLEEEKLARDVYQFLGDLWSHQTFLNIVQSEAQHMSAVTTLLEANALPFTVEAPGEFQNPELQALYDQLTEQGRTDLSQALKVGALIEDLDIADLETFIQATDHPDLIRTFERLQCGSRNHLRAFSNALDALGDTYTPAYISAEEYQVILANSNERCGR